MGCFRTYQFLAKSSSSVLLNTLQKLRTTKTSNSVLLFSVSTNVPELEKVVSYLSSSAVQSIGCISGTIPGHEHSAVCSVAYFDQRGCIPFRSTIPGKSPVQVGRWLTRNENTFAPQRLTGRFPDFSQDVSLWRNVEEIPMLPEPLSTLCDAHNLVSVVYFTDDNPEGLVGALRRLPNVKQLGLVASHTPFITGLPFTLFYNGKQFSSGAVGVAFKDTYQTGVESIDYTRLLPFSEPMEIHRVDGNLIHVLDDLNPTELLLKAIAAKSSLRIGKNDALYLGHLYSSSTSSNHSVRQVYRILAGGQSRGTLALEGDASLKTGDFVQFYILQSHTADLPSAPNSFNFICTGKDEETSFSDKRMPSDDIKTLENFTIASENGFVISDSADKSPFRCTVPGTIVHTTPNIEMNNGHI